MIVLVLICVLPDARTTLRRPPGGVLPPLCVFVYFCFQIVLRDVALGDRDVLRWSLRVTGDANGVTTEGFCYCSIVACVICLFSGTFGGAARPRHAAQRRRTPRAAGGPCEACRAGPWRGGSRSVAPTRLAVGTLLSLSRPFGSAWWRGPPDDAWA